MKNDLEEKCRNCNNYRDYFKKFTRSYCYLCYPIILKIEKIKSGKNLINHDFLTMNCSDRVIKLMNNELKRQLECRLDEIKDTNFHGFVREHHLEYKINGALNRVGAKNLGKINDGLKHHLPNDKERSYVYRLFSKIMISKKFKMDIYRILEVRNKEFKKISK